MASNNIPTDNEEREKVEKLKVLSEALGLNNFQIEIDSLKDNVGYLRKIGEDTADRMNKVIDAVNNLTVKSEAQPAQQNIGANFSQMTKGQQAVSLLSDPSAIEGFTKLLEGVGKAWSAFRGNNNQPSQTGINFQEMGAEFMALLMKTSFDKLLMSTYDVKLPAPTKLIAKVSSDNSGIVETHELQ